MTYIPGTGKVTSKGFVEPQNTQSQDGSPVIVSVTTTVKGNSKSEKKNVKWFDKPLAWAGLGLLGSCIFVVFALLDTRFLIFVPLGPIVGIASWETRSLVKKHLSQNEKYFD